MSCISPIAQADGALVWCTQCHGCKDAIIAGLRKDKEALVQEVLVDNEQLDFLRTQNAELIKQLHGLAELAVTDEVLEVFAIAECGLQWPQVLPKNREMFKRKWRKPLEAAFHAARCVN